MFSRRNGGHLKKQGDSAVLDGGRYFVGANHHSGRKTTFGEGILWEQTIRMGGDILWEQTIRVGGGQFRGKPYWGLAWTIRVQLRTIQLKGEFCRKTIQNQNQNSKILLKSRALNYY